MEFEVKYKYLPVSSMPLAEILKSFSEKGEIWEKIWKAKSWEEVYRR